MSFHDGSSENTWDLTPVSEKIMSTMTKELQEYFSVMMTRLSFGVVIVLCFHLLRPDIHGIVQDVEDGSRAPSDERQKNEKPSRLNWDRRDDISLCR